MTVRTDELGNEIWGGTEWFAPTIAIDKSRWKFDEDGFALATNAAMQVAAQQMREKARSIHDDIMTAMHPTSFDVTVGGVPIDKVKFEG